MVKLQKAYRDAHPGPTRGSTQHLAELPVVITVVIETGSKMDLKQSASIKPRNSISFDYENLVINT